MVHRPYSIWTCKRAANFGVPIERETDAKRFLSRNRRDANRKYWAIFPEFPRILWSFVDAFIPTKLSNQTTLLSAVALRSASSSIRVGAMQLDANEHVALGSCGIAANANLEFVEAGKVLARCAAHEPGAAPTRAPKRRRGSPDGRPCKNRM